MPVEPATIAAISALWTTHALQYDPAIYGLILCGGETLEDKAFFHFAMSHRAIIDDMAGPYTSLALVASRRDGQTHERSTGRDVGYFEVVSSWHLHAPGVYSVANALKVPLDQLPAIVLSAEPQASNRSLVVSVRQVRTDDETGPDKEYVEMMKTLLSACRAAADEPPTKRLRLVQNRMQVPGEGKGMLGRIVDTGIIAQIIEGLVKGFS